MVARNASALVLDLDAPETPVVTAAPTATDALVHSDAPLMFERLASDPNVPVDKLERLIALQERILDRNAETAFNIAFAEMQAVIPTIKELARTDKTSYAPLEDIIGAVRPILSAHGFSLSFRTEWPDKKTVKVVGILTHREGHARTSEFMADADQTGSKNAIQALGSSVQYGKRYTTKDLLCIVTTDRIDRDDDGEGSTLKDAPDAPDAFQSWVLSLEAEVPKGTPALMAAFNKGAEQLRLHLVKHHKLGWESMKQRAAEAGKGRGR